MRKQALRSRANSAGVCSAPAQRLGAHHTQLPPAQDKEAGEKKEKKDKVEKKDKEGKEKKPKASARLNMHSQQSGLGSSGSSGMPAAHQGGYSSGSK